MTTEYKITFRQKLLIGSVSTLIGVSASFAGQLVQYGELIQRVNVTEQAIKDIKTIQIQSQEENKALQGQLNSQMVSIAPLQKEMEMLQHSIDQLNNRLENIK